MAFFLIFLKDFFFNLGSDVHNVLKVVRKWNLQTEFKSWMKTFAFHFELMQFGKA